MLEMVINSGFGSYCLQIPLPGKNFQVVTQITDWNCGVGYSLFN